MSLVIGGEPSSSEVALSPEVDRAFIEKALLGANTNALRLALYQVTGDEELLRLRVVDKLIRGGAIVQKVVAEEDCQTVRDKALEWLLHGRHNKAVPPPPSRERARELMTVYTCEDVPDKHFELDWEELAFDDVPREAKWTGAPPSAEQRQAFSVLIIGAGINGIQMGIQLKRLGIPFTIIEKLDAWGGTWYVNQYPDCRVDTPSHLFSFKFEKSYEFSEYFASAGETLRYLQHCVDKYGLKEHVIFNVEAQQARWQEDAAAWKVHLRHNDGRTEHKLFNFVVSCSGSLSNPKLPDIAGISSFKGRIFHTQAWDHTAKIQGAKVAVIGCGSTGA
jgi:4-hydroxyacetophenone monooxygenase